MVKSTGVSAEDPAKGELAAGGPAEEEPAEDGPAAGGPAAAAKPDGSAAHMDAASPPCASGRTASAVVGPEAGLAVGEAAMSIRRGPDACASTVPLVVLEAGDAGVEPLGRLAVGEAALELPAWLGLGLGSQRDPWT